MAGTQRLGFLGSPHQVWAVLLAAGILLAAASTRAADDTADPLVDLVGRKINIVLKTNKTIDDAEVTKVVTAGKPNLLRAITVKVPPQGRVQTVAATTIDELYEGEQPLDVVFDRRTQSISYSYEKRKARVDREAKILERLAAQRQRFWPKLDSDEQKQLTADLKKELDETTSKFGVKLAFYETKYYLFYTNMPPEQIGGYIQQLDLMYTELCKAFTIPPDTNIWHGKCAVVCFVDKEDFYRYEKSVMNNPKPEGAQGICHSSSGGRVIVTCYRGNDPAFFGVVLVHETSHGFMHRYRSTARIPSWMNEGVADWIAATVVKSDDEVPRRQRAAADQLRQTGTLGGNFFDTTKNIDSWQYGVASAIVDMLLKIDGRKYKKLIDGIKEGLEWEESLKEAYSMSSVEMVQRYGQSIGVPNLRP